MMTHLRRRTVCSLLAICVACSLGGCEVISAVGNFVLGPFLPDEEVAAPEPALDKVQDSDETLAAGDTSAPDAMDTAEALPQEEPALVVETLPPTDDLFETPDGELITALSLTTLDNGIEIHELRLGDGDTCIDESTVVVRYHATFEDDTVFDTTRDGEPAGPWPLAQLIRGWSDGMRGMAVGGIRRVIIPAALAYGDDDVVDPETGDVVIPGGSTLVFSIELIELR